MDSKKLAMILPQTPCAALDEAVEILSPLGTDIIRGRLRTVGKAGKPVFRTGAQYWRAVLQFRESQVTG